MGRRLGRSCRELAQELSFLGRVGTRRSDFRETWRMSNILDHPSSLSHTSRERETPIVSRCCFFVGLFLDVYIDIIIIVGKVVLLLLILGHREQVSWTVTLVRRQASSSDRPLPTRPLRVPFFFPSQNVWSTFRCLFFFFFS